MVDRLNAQSRDLLFEAVRPLGAVFDETEQRAVRAVFRELLAGRPVGERAVADATGWPPRQAHRFVAQLPHGEFDSDGGLIGFGGMTLRTTPHQIEFNGAVRYAWCAWDTLFLPVVLDTPALVTSACPQTGRDITLTVDSDGIADRNPDTIVMSFVQLDSDTASDLRSGFCSLIRFFVDDVAAQTWIDGAPQRLVIHLDDAFDLGRRCIYDRYGSALNLDGTVPTE